jgi:hypothetical protein
VQTKDSTGIHVAGLEGYGEHLRLAVALADIHPSVTQTAPLLLLLQGYIPLACFSLLENISGFTGNSVSYGFIINITFGSLFDQFCGLVVRIVGYRFGGPGSIPGTTRKK